jgi:hypothetical protein
MTVEAAFQQFQASCAWCQIINQVNAHLSTQFNGSISQENTETIARKTTLTF